MTLVRRVVRWVVIGLGGAGAATVAVMKYMSSKPMPFMNHFQEKAKKKQTWLF